MAGNNGTLKGLGKSCILVIVVAGVERFAFKGVASNLVNYLTEVMKLSNSSAAKTINTWCGLCFLLPLFGAYLADSFFGRYATILASSLLYVVGLATLTITTFTSEWISKTKPKTSSLLLSLLLISIGQGGYNPCLQAFGAEQLDNADDELPLRKEDEECASNKKTSFFQWWYIGICSGSLLGVILISYIQDALGWGLGFSIPTVAMALSIAPFLCGTRCYKYNEQKGANKNNCFEKLIQAMKRNVSEMVKMINCRITLPPNQSDIKELEVEEKPFLSQAFHSSERMDDEKKTNDDVDRVGDKNVVLRLLPIWAALLVFAIIFQQPSTFFIKQGMVMTRNIGKNFLIPPATFQSAINISIILLMPLYGKLITPILSYITPDNKRIHVMERMGIGMFVCIIAMVIAALVETKRLEISTKSGEVSLSIFWLLPQYILLGISDVFTVVGMQEFFYSEVPNRMKTIGMAMHLSVFGVGSFLSALLISVLEIVTSDSEGKHSWFSDDMKEARLNRYYLLLAFLSALSLILFVKTCKKHISSSSSEN